MYTSSPKESNDTAQRSKTAADHIKAASDHIEEGGQGIKKDACDTASRVNRDLHSVAHAAGEQVRDFVETASNASGSVATQISRNPLTAAAVLLGFGVLLGSLFRR